MPVEKVLGAVLAGGASRRMGFDKRTLAVGGQTLVARSVAILSATCEDVVVSIQPDEAWPVDGPRAVRDRDSRLGPLAGVEAALAEASLRGLPAAFVLACDLPGVSIELVRHLLARATEAPDVAVVVPSLRGRRQPLCALYRVGALTPVRERLETDDRSLRSLLAVLPVQEEPIGSAQPFFRPDLFHNLNRPADLAGTPRGSSK